MEPGGKLEGETQKSFEAFCIYREEKTLEKTRKKLGKCSGYMRQLEDWSRKYGWVRRSEEWQDYLDAKIRKEYENKKLRWVKQEEQICDTVIGMALSALKEKSASEMSHSEILSYLKEGMDRRSRLTKTDVNIQIGITSTAWDELTIEELRALAGFDEKSLNAPGSSDQSEP